MTSSGSVPKTQAPDNDVITGLHQTATRNIRQPGIGRAVEIVDFDQPDPGGVIRSTIAIDPNYAPAYAGLCDYYHFSAIEVASRPELLAQARSAAKKALALDPTLAEPHASLGLIAMNYDWDWATAEKEFRRAIELNPNYATAHHWYAEYLIAGGRAPESLAAIRRARELDPLSLIINTDTGKIPFYARENEAAIAQLRETLKMDPQFEDTHLWLGVVYASTGRFEEAIAECQQIRDNLWSAPCLGYAYGISGRKEEAAKILEQMKQQEGLIDPHALVCVHLGLGDYDQTFAALEKGLQTRSLGMTSLKVNPWYDPLRSDPRFADLLRRTNLAPPRPR